MPQCWWREKDGLLAVGLCQQTFCVSPKMLLMTDVPSLGVCVPVPPGAASLGLDGSTAVRRVSAGSSFSFVPLLSMGGEAIGHLSAEGRL